MGNLSINLKPNFMGLLKCLNSINWFIVFFSLINLSMCIYEDQIGKFDWRQSYVGRIKFAQFDTVSTARKIIVATEENVLAALNLKTGQVVWRHVFESTSSGNIQLLHLSDQIITVTGSNPYLVRGWDLSTGVLIWEWGLTLQKNEHTDFSEWWVQNGLLVHMVPKFGSHIEVSVYNVATGHNRGATSKLPAVWINEGCVLSPPYYTCISGSPGNQLLLSMDVTSDAVQIISKPLAEYTTARNANLNPFDTNTVIPGFLLNEKIILIRGNKFEAINIAVSEPSASVALVDSASGPLVLQTWNDEAKGFTLTAHNLVSGQRVNEIGWSDRSLSIPEPELSAVICTKTAREQHVCRILVTAADDASHLIQQEGRVLWTREEALANVVAVEFVDLPVSDLDAAIESEFDQKEAAKMHSSVLAAFTRRLQSQFQQLQGAVRTLLAGDAAAADEPPPLVRDYFNLHKIMVLLTDAGKIFGMDNLSGEILWKLYEPNLNTEAAVMFTRRSARHPPHDAYLTIVGKHEETGNGLIVSLNPIRGTPVGEQTLHLDVQILQCAVLYKADAQKLHALILLDKDENVQILPESSAPLVENMYMHVADRSSAVVRGYALRHDGERVSAKNIWSVDLSGGGSQRVVWSVSKPAAERIHSAGRVLPDRSVLYKHLNPNLVLLLTEGPDPVHKDVVVATCVDGVSGGVLSAHVHRRARRPALPLHSEHFLAYLYYNDKQRRHEIATLELYEGPERWVPAGAAFSSLRGARAPHVQRHAYIVPAAPAAAALSATERSLTDKHVLLALSTGAIVELPWALLEPRRALSPAGEAREEGLVPYAPELPLPAEAVVNYNATLLRLTRIHTAPSGLESTSLVLATGLDLFYTRIAPSKTFDLLKDDFDYYLISVVLAALVLATYSTKYFAARKMLKMAWK
ncbi:ER membrane protein complex subunit 1 isoform X1 [Bombyx mandarina]|uniref:ER membrane protein complex subunit 1 n=1 Tax=Bombyx mandarina TaxID=7092 RepID=A0A6J2KT15_BOMMA|nr:ER membrane protein complex subunit 1 isoform X1 [Bombyx mandarina]